MKRPDDLRVVLVGPMPPPYGGMANQTRQLAELLRSEGIEVEVVRNNADYRPQWIGRIPLLRAFFRLIPYVLGLWSACRRGGVMHLMANSGWSWHLFAAPAILVARALNVPVLVNYRGGEAESFLESQSRWVLPVLKKAQVLAVPSGFLQKVFSAHGVEAVIVPNVVDLSRFGVQSARKAPNVDAPNLLVARNLEPIYDNATALRAFARLRERWPKAKMSIAGDGPERAALAAVAIELGVADAVTFTGKLDRDAMARKYSEADVMLNPSLVDNTPNSILEAWGCGVPVVSTRVGGVPYLVEEGVDALLVLPGDDAAMAKAVESLLNFPSHWQLLQAAGSSTVKRFTWSEVRVTLLKLYSDLMGSSDTFRVTGSIR